MSQIQSDASHIKGSYWEVPEELYSPISQQAVLLLRSQYKTTASEFIEFRKSDKVKEILTKQFGYGIESFGVSS